MRCPGRSCSCSTRSPTWWSPSAWTKPSWTSPGHCGAWDAPRRSGRSCPHRERDLGITASVGIASTKFVAKIASTRCKPERHAAHRGGPDRGIPAHPAGAGAVGRGRQDAGGAGATGHPTRWPTWPPRVPSLRKRSAPAAAPCTTSPGDRPASRDRRADGEEHWRRRDVCPGHVRRRRAHPRAAAPCPPRGRQAEGRTAGRADTGAEDQVCRFHHDQPVQDHGGRNRQRRANLCRRGGAAARIGTATPERAAHRNPRGTAGVDHGGAGAAEPGPADENERSAEVVGDAIAARFGAAKIVPARLLRPGGPGAGVAPRSGDGDPESR